MASTTICRKPKGNADEDSDCDGNDDISESSDETDFCIKEWWYLREELKRYPNFIDMEDLKLQKKSSILRFLYQAQLFKEKFGSGALSDDQKHRRKMHEQAVQLDIHHEKERDDSNVTAKKPRVNYDLIEGMLIVEVERFIDPASGVRKQGKSKVRARTFEDMAACGVESYVDETPGGK